MSRSRSTACHARPVVGRRILITGGTRSGKSHFAETLVDGIADVTYVATGGSRPDDAEWAHRVRLHQDRRPGTWTTLETVDLPAALAHPVVLIDSLTTWLSRSMFTDEGGPLTPPVDALLTALTAATGTLVIVTAKVGSGVIAATAAGCAFADAIGSLNCSVAARCDEVWLCVAGIPMRLQG
jgi:adenosylcobinamide kinase/adenosylcobinamide-phosphate guanylyltransferase